MHLAGSHYKTRMFVVVFTRTRNFPSPKPDESTPHPSVLCVQYLVYVGIQNYIEEPTRCKNNLLIYKISSTCFGQYFLMHMVSCCGRQGFGERQRGTTCKRSATLTRQTPVYHNNMIPYAVKKTQSYSPEDGENIARNMFSWSWRSINCYCCI